MTFCYYTFLDDELRRQNRAEYEIWKGIIKRCTNEKHHAWKDYGERGIKICDRWRYSFTNFFTDMGKRPESNSEQSLEIDRINNNGNYEPENCKWSTRKEQARNRRSNHLITYKGETKCIAEWSEILGISENKIKIRISKGKSLEQIFQPGKLKRIYSYDNNHKDGHLITYNNQTYAAARWDRILGFSKGTILRRIRAGWPVERAMTIPISRSTRKLRLHNYLSENEKLHK